jgi:PilZ domain
VTVTSDIDGADEVGVPHAGSRLAVMSQRDGVSFEATVQSWDLSDTGLVVRAVMTVSAEAVVLLADGQVWVSRPASGDRGVTIFAGVAQPVDSTTLEVTGVVALVREQRRSAPRTATPAGVSVSSTDRIRQMRAIDLSRGGVRVALGADSDLHLGEHVQLDVQLEDGATVTASGEVTRVDELAGQAVVQFDDLPTATGARIDRFVLLRLTGGR